MLVRPDEQGDHVDTGIKPATMCCYDFHVFLDNDDDKMAPSLPRLP